MALSHQSTSFRSSAFPQAYSAKIVSFLGLEKNLTKISFKMFSSVAFSKQGRGLEAKAAFTKAKN
jgi:hypothetical protein